MGGFVGVVLAIVFMMGVLIMVVGGAKPWSSSAGRGRLTGRDVFGWTGPFTWMFAAASLLEWANGSQFDAWLIGLLFGLLAALCTEGGGGEVFSKILTDGGEVFCFFATVVVLVSYVTGHNQVGKICVEGEPFERLIHLVLLLALFSLGSMFRIAAEGWKNLWLMPSAIFASAEMMIFLASPFGVELDRWGWIVGIIGACLIGGLAGFVPKAFTVISAAGLGLFAIGSSTFAGNVCTMPGMSGGALMLIAFVLVLLAATWAKNLLLRR
ncbi:MAG: hypothetical protein QM621_01960 [Aeromicrobium sp.]|uniref:hypothetical protein n=1 Tax=Aeromicrobium sp. TaxID=1871063 RepID=UPI0039E52FFC